MFHFGDLAELVMYCSLCGTLAIKMTLSLRLGTDATKVRYPGLTIVPALGRSSIVCKRLGGNWMYIEQGLRGLEEGSQ